MSGLYDIKRMTGGYSDENVYAVNPMDFMRHEHEPGRLAAFRRQDIIMAIGRDDPMCDNNCEFSGPAVGEGHRQRAAHLGWPCARLAILGADGADVSAGARLELLGHRLISHQPSAIVSLSAIS